MTKKEARRYYLAQRQALTPQEVAAHSKGLLHQFEQLTLPVLQFVHVYQPIAARKEIDTAPFIQHLLKLYPGLTVMLPRITNASEMEHVRWDGKADLLMNSWGIHEPAAGEKVRPMDIDLVIVPLVAFDTNGFRVGYGKGFYDRFLAQCRPDVLKIGLNYFEPVARIADTDQFDVPLSIGLTPKHLYEF